MSAKDRARERLEDAIERELAGDVSSRVGPPAVELPHLEEPARFPPDAPIVPNDAWEYRPRPSRCRWLLPHRDVPDRRFPSMLRCQRCGAITYVVPSRRWGGVGL